MAEFLEERLPVGVRMGASYGDEYAVEITENAAGAEFRRLVTPFPKRRWSVEYTQATSALWDNVVALYHRAYGTYAGFRVHCIDDNSTNGRAGQPTATDQVLALVSAGFTNCKRVRRRGRRAGRGLPKRTLFAGGRFGTLLDCQYPHPECRLDPRFNRRTHHACRQYLGSRHGNQQGRPGRHHPRRPRALRRHGGVRLWRCRDDRD